MEGKALLEEVAEKAGEELGVRRWDRPAVFRDAADAATDTDLPYWTVLVLSGAIATLGLALNSAAVVIGAMLVAPLLAPVVGLALALAVGDGRLALQTAATVLVSTLAVVVVGALLTAVLPYQSVTAEITARTRPTTLDLGIAVFSGLAGVVVTVARGHRLSAAIPGVAISVALIPPLAVAGFGIGAGWHWELIRGSLLLYGANLAGIVLSGMLVFMLVGMHREEVLEAARRWHREESISGLVQWLDRFAWVRSLGLIRSQWARVGLVVGFVVAVAVPLSRTLREITREVRVRAAVEDALGVFEITGRSSVLDRQVVHGGEGTQVFVRVATTRGFGEPAREEFVRQASAAAGEPVRLVLEQLPASSGSLEELARLFPTSSAATSVAPPPPPPPPTVAELAGTVRERLRAALAALPLPDGVRVAGAEFAIEGGGGMALQVGYLAPEPLAAQAAQVLGATLVRALDTPGLRVSFARVAFEPLALADSLPSATAGEVAELLQRFPGLRAELGAGAAAAERARAARAVLLRAGADSARVVLLSEPEPGVRLRLGDAAGPVPAPLAAPAEPRAADVPPRAP